MYKKVVLLALVVILGVVNWSIYKKEQHLKNGKVVYLELRPADPRSLMQGDYMALRYRLENKILRTIEDKKIYDGYIVITLDDKKVAHFKRLYDGGLASGEVKIRYRYRSYRVKFGTNSYFFKEGTAKKYQHAKYGKFVVDKDGELLLVGLADENVTDIK